MNPSAESTKAKRLLQGLEDGSLTTDQARVLAQDIDPVLVHVIMRFLRENYPASNRLATAALGRLTALTAIDPKLVAKAKEGEQDPVSRWFASQYDFRDFRGRGHEMIELIVDKLES